MARVLLVFVGIWRQVETVALHGQAFLCTDRCFGVSNETGRSEIWATNDRLQEVEVKGTVRVFTFEGQLVHTADLSASVEAGSTLQLRKMSVDALAPARAEVFAVLDVAVAGETLRNEHAFVPWKSCDLPKADVQCRVVEKRRSTRRCDQNGRARILSHIGSAGPARRVRRQMALRCCLTRNVFYLITTRNEALRVENWPLHFASSICVLPTCDT